MRFFKLLLLAVIVIATAGAGGMWYLAGREAGPSITINSPQKFIGRGTPFSITVEAPTEITGATVYFEQNGKPLQISQGKDDRSEHKVVMSGTVVGAANGPATMLVEAARKTFFGYRQVFHQERRELTVRVDPPRVAVVSTHQFINLGGAEFVVLKATPEDVEAGVQAGDARFRFYPGSAVGISDPSVRVGFFALRHDQDINTRITAYARDEAGNEATAPVDHQPFVKKFIDSKIPIDQAFLDRVVPAIASNTPEIKVDTSSPEGLLKGFLEMNGNLRKKNAEYIASLAAKSQPKMLWTEAFEQMGNSQVESRFADRRTYFFENKEIDRQVHLGFDLATVQHAPVHASNAGVVVHAAFLGIYGNCVILDHGLGVNSLYGHLSEIEVKVGDTVTKGQEIGRSGSTGLAGGDHLHFTMLVEGVPVNPVEWWDPHWLQDRVYRKIGEAGGPAFAKAAAGTPEPAAPRKRRR